MFWVWKRSRFAPSNTSGLTAACAVVRFAAASAGTTAATADMGSSAAFSATPAQRRMTCKTLASRHPNPPLSPSPTKTETPAQAFFVHSTS